MVVPKEEFDFEKSNAKFERSEDVEEYKQPVYNKSSFFDDISSEAKDREGFAGFVLIILISSGDIRAKMNQERKTNVETFGQSGLRNNRGRRGRGRGGHQRDN
jgi:protein LSM14